MVTALKVTTLLPPKSPNLLIAPVEYSQQYQDQFSNALRLYYSQLDNYTQALSSTSGGAYIAFPYGAFQNTTSMYTTNNTATVVPFNSTDYSNAVSLVSSSRITVTNPGIYNLQYSFQFVNNDITQHTAYVWLRKNGTNVEGTASKFDLQARKNASIDTYVLAACNFYISLTSNDYVELVWATDLAATLAGGLGIYIEAYGIQTTPFIMPSIPSAVATLTFVSLV